MSQTSIPVGSALARKVYGAALFASTQRQSTFTNRYTGAAPQQGQAEAKLKGQTSPDMPFVRVTDLSKSAGDTVSVDLIHQTTGHPIMGDRMAEGKGRSLSFSTMDVKIDLATQVVDAGGKMTQQRTVHGLRGLAMANLVNWFNRFHEQATMVHLAGARGVQGGVDWVVPLQSEANFSEVMINSVLAPSYNRHFVADGTGIVAGGAQLASIDTGDTLKLECIDALATVIADSEYKLQPIKLPDDPAASDEPLYAMFITHRQWNSILTNTSNTVWRTLLQNAWNRASYGSKHPLFTGETIMWRNIVLKKMDRAIRFNGSQVIKHITAANRYTATETDVTIAALNATTKVDRAMLLGAQALAHVYGRSQNSDTYSSWMERPYNFGRNLEVAGDTMGGKSKLRFSVPDADGNLEPTDNGVIVLDTVVPV